MRHWRTTLAVIATVALVGTACGPSQESGAGGGTSAPEEKPVAGGRVIYGDVPDIQRLNPATSNDATSSRVSSKIYDALVIADYKTGEIKPWLGSWTLSSDGLTYTWTIDAKANWSDGKPVIGNDYLARVKMQGRSKVTPNRSTFNDVEGYQDYVSGKATSISGIQIDSANPKKFTVKFAKVFCNITNVFGAAPMPEHIFGKYTVDNDPAKNVDDAAENNAPPVSSGPFKFKEWRKGDQVILTRNDTYFKGAPLVDEFVFKVVADSTVLAAQLKTGELTHGLVQPGDVADLEKATNLKLYKWPDNGYVYIGWRVNNPNVAFLGDKPRETFLQVAVEQYKQIGVKINPKLEAFESLVPKLTGGSPEVEAVIIGWQLSADPDPFTIWHSSNVASPTKSGNNFVGYSNPPVDQLIDQGRNGPDF